MKRAVGSVVLSVVLLPFTLTAAASGNIPAKWVGKWKGLSGKMEAADKGQTGTAVTSRDLGHLIEEFEFEVSEDGSVEGKGKAKYWFNVASQADLLVTKVGPTAYLEGGTQVREFEITGTLTADGKLTLDGTPGTDLVLINAGKRSTLGAWNVFGPNAAQIRNEDCQQVANGDHVIAGPPITMKIAWKAQRACKVDCEVDRSEPGGMHELRTGKVEKVILHCTGGLHDKCDLSMSYKGGTVNGIVNEFRRAADANEKKSIHYIIGRDGQVVRMVPEDRVAYHNYRNNQKYVGIEMINHGDGNDPYPLEQVNAAAELVAEILRCHGLTSNDVLGHGDVDQRMNNNCTPPRPRRTDPAENFPWEFLRTRIDAILAED